MSEAGVRFEYYDGNKYVGIKGQVNVDMSMGMPDISFLDEGTMRLSPQAQLRRYELDLTVTAVDDRESIHRYGDDQFDSLQDFSQFLLHRASEEMGCRIRISTPQLVYKFPSMIIKTLDFQPLGPVEVEVECPSYFPRDNKGRVMQDDSGTVIVRDTMKKSVSQMQLYATFWATEPPRCEEVK